VRNARPTAAAAAVTAAVVDLAAEGVIIGATTATAAK